MDDTIPGELASQCLRETNLACPRDPPLTMAAPPAHPHSGPLNQHIRTCGHEAGARLDFHTSLWCLAMSKLMVRLKGLIERIPDHRYVQFNSDLEQFIAGQEFANDALEGADLTFSPLAAGSSDLLPDAIAPSAHAPNASFGDCISQLPR
jgi:hypothetical protein